MKYTSFNTNGLTGTRISRPQARIIVLKFSVALNREHFARTAACDMIYTDALISGSGTYTRGKFLDAVNNTGGSLDVSMYGDILTISLKVIDTNLQPLLSLFLIMLTNPTFAGSELKRSKETIANELDEYKENARARAIDGLRSALYAQTSPLYTFEPEKIQKELLRVSRKEILSIHKTILKQPWTVTVAGGEKKTQHIVKKLTLFRKKNPVGKQKEKTFHTPQPVQKKVLKFISIPSKQNIEFNIGNIVPITLYDKDYTAFVFGFNVLALMGGFTGRLMSTVREKEGLTYGIYGRVTATSTDDYGYYNIATFFAPNNAHKGITSTLREIRSISEHGITDDEFVRFKAILGTREILTHDSLLRVTGELHSALLSGRTFKEFIDLKKKIQQLKKQDINNALAKYLSPDALVISVAGPVKTVKEELESFRK